MKKKLLIFFIVLIVIFLIIFFFFIRNDNINEIINNTIYKTDEYKLTLTLKNIYYIGNKKIDSKIIYIEQKKNNLYKFTNKMYDNNYLKQESINYLDNKKYYYKDNNKYIYKEVKNVDEIKDFKIDFTDFFNKVKKITYVKSKDGKMYYKSKMKTEDAFSLIYSNSKNNDLDKYTYVTFITSNDKIEEIKFNTIDKNNNSYYVNLCLDFSLQDIKLSIN